MASVERDIRNDSWLARWRDPGGRSHKKSFARKADAQRFLDQLVPTCTGDGISTRRTAVRLWARMPGFGW
jgi:hypothetical protein